MTVHTHDPAAHADSPRPGPVAGDATATTAARPRWLLPGLAAGIIAGALVVAGVLSLSTVLFVGLFGGMLLMHMGGHGEHGGHGAQGGHGGHGGHGGGATPDAGNLRTPSSGTQLRRSGSTDELDDRASTEEGGVETHDHDKRSSHGCH